MRKSLSLILIALLCLTFCAPAFAEEPVKIRFVHPGASQVEMDWCAQFAEYAKETYNVEIEFLNIAGSDVINKVTIMSQAGDWPDLVGAQDVTDYAAAGILDPIMPYVEADASFSTEGFNQAGIEFATVNGVTYYLPSTVVPYGLLINTAVFEEAGVDYDAMKTWDDLLQAAKTINEKTGKKAYGFCGSVPRFHFRDFYILAASNGVTYDKLADPALKQNLIEIFEFYKKMQPYTIENTSSVEWGDVHKYMIDGNIAMLGTGVYFSAYMSGLSNDCLSYLRPIAYPTGPSAQSTKSLIGGFGYAIFSGSQHKDIAWQLIKDAYQQRFVSLVGTQNFPAIEIDQELIDANIAKYFPNDVADALDIVSRWKKIVDETGISQPIIVGQSEVERNFAELFYLFMDDEITTEQFYDQFIAIYSEVTAA